MKNLFDLTGKVALVTGASSGLGVQFAKALANQGADIAICARRLDKLEAVKAEIEALGVKCYVHACDAMDPAQVKATVDAVAAHFGKIDILVNNAGLAAGLEHIDQGSIEDWNAMIDTNIKGLLYVTRIVSRRMIEQQRGHIVNLGSIAGTQPYENGAVYCASKHAVHAISQSMRSDLVAHGIKVSEVRPVMVETEFSVVRFHGDEERAKGVYKGVTPLTGAEGI